MPKYSNGYKVFQGFNTIFMLLFSFITLYPLLFLFAISLSDANAIYTGKVTLWPIGFNLSAYKLVFEHPNFGRGFINTILYTVVGTALSLFYTVISAYPLSKKKLKGRKLFMKIILVTMFFSGGLIPYYLVVRSVGIYNTLWAVTLPGAWSAWNMIIVMTFFQGIPESLEESAAIEGLNPIQILIRIIIPLSTPVIATIGLFSAVGTWNDWFNPLIFFKDNKKFPIMLFLKNIVSGEALAAKDPNAARSNLANMTAENLRTAAIIIVTLPILAIYPFLQKYFVKGVMIGSIKG